MPKQKRPTRKAAPQTPLIIRDADGMLHKQAAAISASINGATDYAGGVRYALGFTAAYLHNLPTPIDYSTASLSTLRDYVIHGYGFTIRAAALAELEQRIKEMQA